MDRAELRVTLDDEGIRPDAYSLEGGFYEDRLCIDEIYGQWSVYYVERGKRREKRTFPTEDEACRHLLELLTDDHQSRS